MYYVMTEREVLVGFLPSGGVGAEVGVAAGDFAQVLVERTEPRCLHLIDPWCHMESDAGDPRAFLDGIARAEGQFYGPEYNKHGDAQLLDVVRRFADRPEVEIHQQFSYKIAREFAPQTFDYVYIDGNHTYEYVLQDLYDFADKLKDDGVILGHDFFEDAFAAEHKYGVIDAVRRFLARRPEFHMICLTHEPFPSYALARGTTGFAGRFVSNLLDSDVFVVEIGEEQAFRYAEKSHMRSDGRARRIPSFAP